MARSATRTQFDKNAIRNWTLYVIRFTDGHHYVGITSRSNYKIRIHQHGGRFGAKVNQGKVLDHIVEVRQLGRMSGKRASDTENEVTLEYRKKCGARKVRGGYDVFNSTSIIPTYTPGSTQSIIFIAVCLLMALVILVAIINT